MRKRIAAIFVAVSGALLFWRRNNIKDDSKRIAGAAQGAAAGARRRLEDRMGAKRAKFAELGQLVHQAHADPESGDNRAAIDALLAEIDEMIASEAADDETIDLTDTAAARSTAEQPA